MDVSETPYAKSGDVRIAYQVVGNGSVELVFVPEFVSNLDVWWEEPSWAQFWGRLATFSRLILFDKRGTGLSDHTAPVANLEDRMDDVRACAQRSESQLSDLLSGEGRRWENKRLERHRSIEPGTGTARECGTQ
jgi:pimeloyl-ACP methyl ester carboxylesterase